MDLEFEYVDVSGEIEITTNQIVAVVSGSVNVNYNGRDYTFNKYEYVNQKDSTYTLSSNDAVISIVTL